MTSFLCHGSPRRRRVAASGESRCPIPFLSRRRVVPRCSRTLPGGGSNAAFAIYRAAMLPLCPVVVAVSHANADRPQPATRAGVIDHKAFLARGLADTKACFGARAIRYDSRRLQL